jgi:two-component system KDP operon response regulator KdpE
MTDARAHVLVVDDEPQILRGLKVILRSAGFEVSQAQTKREALDAVAVRPPDVMILDLVLPDGSGVEVCAEVRRWSSLPIIVLSAVGDEREKVRALDAGADDYVTKPFGTEELTARIRAVLRRRDSADGRCCARCGAPATPRRRTTCASTSRTSAASSSATRRARRSS